MYATHLKRIFVWTTATMVQSLSLHMCMFHSNASSTVNPLTLYIIHVH